MTWAHVARKDFEDAGRSLLLWVLTGLLILLVAGVSAIPSLIAEDGVTPTFEDGVSFLFTPIGFLIPIIGLIVGYRSIVGERESGSIRFLLGLPNTRRDVLLGKVLGRAAVVGVPTLIGFGVGGAVIAVLYEGFDVSDYVGLFVFSLSMGLLYVAVAVGISASVSSRAKALTGVVGFFVIFDFLWSFVPMAVYWVIESELPAFDGLPAWYVFVERLSPSEALSAIALTLIDFAGTGDVDLTTEARIAGDVPFYLEAWFAWIIVVLWIVVPLAIGYLRFRRATLN